MELFEIRFEYAEKKNSDDFTKEGNADANERKETREKKRKYKS